MRWQVGAGASVMDEDFILIKEGKAEIKVPNPDKYLRPDKVFEPAWAPVFYNPAQVLNRDVSVLVLKTLLKSRSFEKPVRAIDPFSGTGVRAIRYGLEVPEIDEIYANDIDSNAYNLILENVRMNGLQGKVRVFRGDANAILYLLRSLGTSFVFVDIDPYGSPAPYIDAGLWSVRNGGVLAVTATDVAPLSGSKHVAGSRRYDVRLSPSDVGLDVGLRTLLGFMARRAAVRDRVISPLLAFYSGHYYRVFVEVSRGASKATEMLSRGIRHLRICTRCGFLEFFLELADTDKCPMCGSAFKILGPLWGGGLSDAQFLRSLRVNLQGLEYLQSSKRLAKLLEAIEGELTDLPMYNLITLARFLKVNIPPIMRFIECLREAGFKACKTHLSPQCVRTNATYDTLVRCTVTSAP
ncbi:MAG: tRNA (guanine(10)-N(2))-dimethyltransferase [Zestosphaera sp.]